MMMLETHGVSATYGGVQVLHDIDMTVGRGEIVAIVGANGAGKTTLMRSLAGLMSRSRGAGTSGAVICAGEDISALPAAARLRRGLCLVPEGRELWPELTVRDHLQLGAFSRRGKEQRREFDARFEEVIELFPRVGERLNQPAGTLSGGEQQMVAIARALMSSPQLLLCDEPSMGLAPVVVDHILAAIRSLQQRGLTIVLVEQMVNLALEIADRAYVLERGRMVISGSSAEIRADARVREAYLGGVEGEESAPAATKGDAQQKESSER